MVWWVCARGNPGLAGGGARALIGQTEEPMLCSDWSNRGTCAMARIGQIEETMIGSDWSDKG